MGSHREGAQARHRHLALGRKRFTGADAVDVEHTVIASSGDLAYTAGFERSHVSVDGGPLRDMVIRVTHIYRRIDGDWKLVHRHADFPPPDQRNTAAG
jgi:ketosteroid isomerase-like protein